MFERENLDLVVISTQCCNDAFLPLQFTPGAHDVTQAPALPATRANTLLHRL